MSNAAVRLIDRHVEGSLGHKPAFDFNDKTYSYHDVAALANRAGNLLKSLGIGAGARVVMLLPQSPAYVATLVGAMKVGAVPVVVVNPAASAAAAKGAALAVVHEKFIREFSSGLAKEKVLVVGQAPQGHPSFVDGMRAQASSLAAEVVPPQAPALVIVDTQSISLSHGELDSALAAGDPRLGRVAPILQAMAAAQTAVLM